MGDDPACDNPWRGRLALPLVNFAEGTKMRLCKASAILLAGLIPALAAAQTWTGGGADYNWSTGANWSGGVAPPSSSTTIVTFTFPPGAGSPVVDAPWTVNRLDFPSGSYQINGQPVTFDGAGAGITAGGGTFSILNHPIVLAAPALITGSGGFEIINGPISGPGSLTVGGNNTVILSGTSTFAGGVTVDGGSGLTMAGSMPGPVSVTSGSTFSGSGNIAGSVSVSVLNASFNLSARLSTGNVCVGSGSLLRVFVNGPGQYGSVDVTGTVNITTATLSLSGPLYAPSAGEVFTIIVNDGTDAVTGNFAGLAEGATVTFNGVQLRISYVGGTGNDITLTAFAAGAPAAIPTLSEWGMLLVAIALLGAGMRRLYR
jgi:hypothetical protein